MDKKILLQNLADTLAERTGVTKRKAEAFVRAFFEITEEGLSNDGIVKVKNFGTTKIVNVSDRESVNINTGERFQIEGHAKITFTPDATFRDLVNRPFAQFTTIVLDDDIDAEDLNNAVSSSEVEEKGEIASTKDDIEDALSTIAETPKDAKTESGKEENVIEENAKEENAEEEDAVEEDAVEEDAVEENVEEEDVQEENVVEEHVEEAKTATDEVLESHIQEDLENDEIEEDENTTTETITHAAQIDGKNSSIIINNTIPEPRHNWWRTAFMLLAMSIIALISYFAGYFRIFCPCNILGTDAETITATEKQRISNDADSIEKVKLATLQADSIAKAKADSTARAKQEAEKIASEEAAKKIAKELAEQKAAAEKAAKELAEQQKETEKATRRQQELQSAQNYQQIPGSNYLITGTMHTRQVRPGENLNIIAKKYYGNKNFAHYISFYNNIEDPNLVTVGQRIKLPRLTKR